MRILVRCFRPAVSPQAFPGQPLTILNRANAITHKTCGKLCANLAHKTQNGTSVLTYSGLHSNVVNSQSVEEIGFMFIFGWVRETGSPSGFVFKRGNRCFQQSDIESALPEELESRPQDRSRFTFLGTRCTSRGRSGLPPFSHALTIMDATAVIESFRRRSRMGRT